MRLRRTPSPDAKIEFLEFHQPKLEAGKYEVFVEQKVKHAKIPETTYTKKLSFVVQAERFGPLPPKDLLAVAPPRDSVGDHSNALPHVTLRRSTLPWERFPGQGDENRSWLALVLLRDSDFETEADQPRLQSIKLSELIATSESVHYPKPTLEEGQQPTDEVTVLDVKWKVLKDILPKAEELALLAHVHQSKSASGALEGEPEATVFCNRLPMVDGKSTVHLVSLEKRYNTSGQFDSKGAGDNDWVRLVSLAHWSFFSVDPEKGFSGLLRNLDRQPSTLQLPVNLPAGSPAAPYVEQGYVPVTHKMRRGSKSVSFYRGPLVPGANPDSVSLPVRCADELVRYDPATGLFDVSYAAAWELGRLLTLSNTRIALELYNWKRHAAQQQRAQRQRAGAGRRLPLLSMRPEEPGMPEAVSQWLGDLATLKGLPFSYLIPDERVLPAEGLRLVRVDPVWVDCLLDGAYSIGRVTEADWEEDRASRSRRGLGEVPRELSGFVMRSAVVAGYPNLLVEAYAQREEDVGSIPAEGMNAVRVDSLADDVLIGLFEGELKTVDFFQAPEGLSFGLDVREDTSSAFTKNLRDRSGSGTELIINPVPFRNADKGMVDMKGVADLMKTMTHATVFTAAQFALQMIEGGPRIRFVASE
ncbi:hypothetical protein [Hyalangium versicolor]|uniref:hypothetical protein n=1 Tax=Hyalangium versicolor TaxID=2861190 RepID=UPI001CC9ADAA|nr:hypothetical protein [Hyalangium versicolor]